MCAVDVARCVVEKKNVWPKIMSNNLTSNLILAELDIVLQP